MVSSFREYAQVVETMILLVATSSSNSTSSALMREGNLEYVYSSSEQSDTTERVTLHLHM